MAAFSWLFEKRPLKRPRLGPPDVYPQDPKQKEDELTAVNVKQGFTSAPHIADEYGSARNANITAAKFGAFFSGILTKKQELNTFQDSARKRQQINTKDNFWPVTARSKNAIEAWFKDLAGCKPLTSLAKKVPISNKKEEIFVTLHEFSVPMMRAAWFIKMSSAHTVAISEAKIKKRQLPDPSQAGIRMRSSASHHQRTGSLSSSSIAEQVPREWTQAICKFLKEQLQKLAEHYHSNSSLGNSSSNNTTSVGSGNNSVSSSNNTSSGSLVSIDTVYKQWQYICQLARHLFEEGLLDRQDFLLWIFELLEKTKSPDDPVMKLIMPLVLQYVDEFVHSELLSRRLTHHCAKKLNQLISEYHNSTPRCQSPMNTQPNSFPMSPTPTQTPFNPVTASILELLSCSHHRNIVLGLSAVIQVVTLECPSALVWNNIGEGRSNSVLNGSPLDILPCAPSSLPMPPRLCNAQIRAELRQAEQQIQARGRAAEVRWSCDKWQQTAAGITIQRVLYALDTLDRHCFNNTEAGNTLDVLYAKTFSTPSEKDQSISGGNTLSEILAQDEPIVRLLCEWAVTTKRNGDHRALVVAKLLEKRQNELVSEKYTDTELADEKDSQESTGMVPLGVPLYQNLLVNFLDTQAPVIDDKFTTGNRTAFSNLVLLFSELIRHDVFSHDAYMCKLVSRGNFANTTNHQIPSINNSIPTTNKPLFMHETCLTGFMHDAPHGLSPAPGSAGYMGMPGLSMSGLGDSGRSQEPLPMFEPPDHHPDSIKHEVPWDAHMDMDDARIDADLDKLLQNIKEGQENMTDQPDSVGSDKDDMNPLNTTTPLTHPPLVPNCPSVGDNGILGGIGSNSSSSNGGATTAMNSTLRHLLYTTHFPLPQDESSYHDCNQRHILLFGVGKARDEARHVVKKVTKEIMKLFSKKTCMDIADGAKIKKHAKEGFNFDAVVNRFQSLSYFDQHVVTLSCASSIVEMLNSFALGSSSYLPLVEYISFLFELMEMALNIHGLIEFTIQLLRELVEVENQLTQKNSVVAGTYATSLGLYIVGVLYKYHCCLLVSQEQTVAVFEGLCKITKHVTDPSNCSSAERCILCYLHDLYSCCFLKTKYVDIFGPTFSKIEETFYGCHEPSAVNLLWDTTCMIENINNPRMKVDPQQIKQLNENPASRYSFVCNAVHSISDARDADRLNEISVLCAELTASCGALSAEWLGVLRALCCSSNHGCGFIDVLTQVDVGDLSIHDNLAVFTSILVARRCFSLQDFVVHVALPSLRSACPVGGVDQDAESGARLTCHLILRLMKTADTQIFNSIPTGPVYPFGTSPAPLLAPSSAQRPMYLIKSPCDRQLLSAAHSRMTIETVLAVLKGILDLVNDASGEGTEAKSKADHNQNKGEISIKDILGPIDDPDFDIGMPPSLGRSTGIGLSGGGACGMETAGLSEFAKHVLRQTCSQEWIRDLCLRDPDVLCNQDLSPDSILTPQQKAVLFQARQLVQMICHPKSEVNIMNEDFSDHHQIITNILQKLDLWTLLVSWLELQLMYLHVLRNESAQSPNDANGWLETVARATIDVFQLISEEVSTKGSNGSSGDGGVKSNHKNEGDKPEKIWLVAPLISKLPASVQGKVLKAAGQVLESGSWSSNSSSFSSSSSKNKDKDKLPPKSASLLSHQPFLSLVLMCLKGQDEQREGLLNSLYSQLSQCLHNAKDDKHGAEDMKTKQSMQEALQLRLSLVGGMFDMIQKNSSQTTDWAVLLVQLISYGVVDPQTNYELFTTVLDMLAVLIHTTQVSDSSSGERGEETRKQYLNLVKKLKKELAEKNSDAIRMVRQLLPLPRQQCEVITCEPMGSLIDTKGNKIAGFDSIDKKQGLQVAETQKVSPWDLLEGHKNPAPLSWAWFGAVRLERKPLRQEEGHRLLLWHTHSLRKSSTYYLEPPPLPPEDLDPCPEKQPPVMMAEDIKRGRETPIEQSPRSGAKKPKQQRRRRQTKMTNGQQNHTIRPGMYPDQLMPYPQTTHQPWYGQQPPMQQATYYSPQQQLPPAGRFERPMSQSKQALSSLLRSRHPSTQFLPGHGGNPQHQPGGGPAVSMQGAAPGHPGGPRHPGTHPGTTAPNHYQNIEMMQKQQIMMRQQLQRPQGMSGGTTFTHAMPGQTAPLHHLPPQASMSQGYGNYSGTPMQQNAGIMETRNQAMMQQGFNQSYVNPQSRAGMMAPTGQQGQYMPQPTRPQYAMSQGAMQAPNVTVGQMGNGMGAVSSGGSHMSVSGTPMVQGSAYGANTGNPAMGGGQAQIQHMQQLRHQQQLIAMQKQQQQQQPQQQQQQTLTLVPQLQRHMANTSQGPHPPPQQHHQFHQPY